MNILYSLLSIAAFVGLWFFNSRILIPKMIEPIRKWPYTKFEKCDPPLGTLNGIGFILCDGWGRYESDTNSNVYYLFFFFFVPIVPVGCYRAREIGRSGNRTQYQIFGHEKWRFGEVVAIYLSYIPWIGGIISLIALIASFFD